MENATIHFTTVFMAFFAIMNPIANAPLGRLAAVLLIGYCPKLPASL